MMDELLTTKQAAALLKTNDTTLRSWRRRGGGPPFTVDPATADNPQRRIVRYRMSDIVAFKEKQDA